MSRVPKFSDDGSIPSIVLIVAEHALRRGETPAPLSVVSSCGFKLWFQVKILGKIPSLFSLFSKRAIAVEWGRSNKHVVAETMNQGEGAERTESLKAGAIAGLTAAIAFSIISLLYELWFVRSGAALPQIWGVAAGVIEAGVSVAIAGLSGFLFGVTYRYIIRTDQNPHLNTGAVLAFGLVRGLAQVGPDALQYPIGGLIAILGESILLFSLARFAIDWSLHQGIVKPFT